jgi:hypothetical protein
VTESPSSARSSAPWDDLARELDAWGALGRTATFWWRDDDATNATPALDRLLELGAAHEVPLVLAVIPAEAVETLAASLASFPLATPVQHGYAHRNHALPGGKAGELGGERPCAAILAELADGWKRLDRLFGALAEPFLVPPWNRIEPSLLSSLPEIGFRLVSTFGPRVAASPSPGLAQVNAHLDIIDWRRDRHFVGEEKALGRLVEHLAARREGSADSAEPTGLLTHHLGHDEGCWGFLELLLRRTAAHPAASWLAAPALLASAKEANVNKAHRASAAQP